MIQTVTTILKVYELFCYYVTFENTRAVQFEVTWDQNGMLEFKNWNRKKNLGRPFAKAILHQLFSVKF